MSAAPAARRPADGAASNLGELIARSGKRKLVFTGFQLPSLISATLMHAYDNGFQLAVVADCVGTRTTGRGCDTDTVREAHLAGFADFFADVVESKDIQ